MAKLTELWNSRIDGCPDAPILEFRDTKPGTKGTEHTFRLISGVLDVPPDRDHPFYDKLLVKDVRCEGQVDGVIPIEALFDDLAVSGYVFPLNRSTKQYWETQPSIVQEELALADTKGIKAIGREIIVTLRIWGTWKVRFEPGAQYRLSPRFVDFNTTKALSSLFEIDLQYETDAIQDSAGTKDLAQVPYLQLILEPQMFGHAPMSERSLKIEGDIQKLFRDLSGLGNESAGALVLKPSQHKAARRILANRLSVIWGPPGETYFSTFLVNSSKIQSVEKERGKHIQYVYLCCGYWRLRGGGTFMARESYS